MPRGTGKPAKSFFERRLFWPLNLDFLAPMRLQVKVQEKKELYYFKGKTTETIETQKRKPIKTELGGKIGMKDSTGRKTVVEYGSRNPKDETRFTQAEIFRDVLSNTGTKDIITKRRGVVHDVPKPAESFETLQDANEIWEEQKAYSNKSKQWRKATGLALRNWYHIVKKKLLRRNIIDQSDVQTWFKTSIRSSLNTEFLLPSNGCGYDTLQRRNKLLPLEKALVKENFWQDTGMPLRLIVNHRNKAEGWIYELNKEGCLIGF